MNKDYDKDFVADTQKEIERCQKEIKRLEKDIKFYKKEIFKEKHGLQRIDPRGDQ